VSGFPSCRDWTSAPLRFIEIDSRGAGTALARAAARARGPLVPAGRTGKQTIAEWAGPRRFAAAEGAEGLDRPGGIQAP
jgi:hypothetical protein